MFFPPDFLTRLEYLSIVSRRVFRGSLLAQRRTMQRGAGIEFSDHREYSPGDDFRYLDWNVYARHGDLLLKRFQEEQDLHVYFLLDCSRSMGAGSPPKFDLARQLVAALAYIALADLDRVTVLSFSEDIIEEFPLTRGKARIVPLMKFLDNQQLTGTSTSIKRTIQGLLHRTQQTGIVILVSDLFDEAGFESGLDQLRYQGSDAHVVQLHAVEEASPKLLGDVELLDIEDNSLRKITVTEQNAKDYQQFFQDHQRAVRHYCHSHQFGCTQSAESMQFDDLVLAMMRESNT